MPLKRSSQVRSHQPEYGEDGVYSMKSGISGQGIPETPEIVAPKPDWTELPWSAGHEQIAFCHDPASGLRAIIAIYTTALGPALGGTRFHPYPNTTAALTDVLALSKAMAYKNALAGLDHGGGKAVIIGDPTRDKTEPLLRAYGRFVASLGGRYVTACDVGTYVADMDVVGRETSFATGRSPADGGAGDSSLLTALGVLHGIRAAAQVRWGHPDLGGRLVGISGVGKVGSKLVPLLLDDGANVVVADPDAAAVAGVLAQHPEVHAVTDTAALLAEPLDVYSPCALGGALTDQVAATLSAAIVCGGANNQLAAPEVADRLAERGVLYCPDFCVNAGGVIQVADELHGFSLDRARAQTERIFDTTLAVLREAGKMGVTPATAAEHRAERRMAEVSAIRRIHVG
jgi:valine dehydrogenase (NAD+)